MSDLADLRAWDNAVDRWIRDGVLRRKDVRDDPMLPGRQHERFSQVVGDIEVFGADIVRQTDRGVTVSLYGNVYEFGELDLDPGLTVAQARAKVEAEFHADTHPQTTLLVLPGQTGSGTLVYRICLLDPTDPRWLFVNADSGEVVLTLPARYTQSVVGTGKGVLGENKKISTTLSAGAYVTTDQLRPPTIQTYDARNNSRRSDEILRLRTGPAPSAADLARDGDNVWTDVAVVDAHTHLGFTYDYLYKRFNYQGLGDKNLVLLCQIASFVSEQRVRWRVITFEDIVLFFAFRYASQRCSTSVQPRCCGV